MNLITVFNYRLAIAAQKGYAKAVQFNIDPLGTAPLIPADSPVRSQGEERSASFPKYKSQLHRANRNLSRAPKFHIHGLDDSELTAEQLAKRIANRAYLAKKKAAKAQLAIVWPADGKES